MRSSIYIGMFCEKADLLMGKKTKKRVCKSPESQPQHLLLELCEVERVPEREYAMVEQEAL